MINITDNPNDYTIGTITSDSTHVVKRYRNQNVWRIIQTSNIDPKADSREIIISEEIPELNMYPGDSQHNVNKKVVEEIVKLQNSNDGLRHPRVNTIQDLTQIDATDYMKTEVRSTPGKEYIFTDFSLALPPNPKVIKLTKIRKLISDAKAGLKNPLYLIAGDSTRDGYFANQRFLYNRKLQALNIDYYHSAQSGIQTRQWIVDRYNEVKPVIDTYDDVIMEYSLGINDFTYIEGANDAEKKVNMTTEIRVALTKIISENPNVLIYLVAPFYSSSVSSILQEVYEELSDEFGLPMMSTPSRTEYQSADIIDNVQFSKDGTHPTYAGALRIFSGIFKFITDENDIDVQNALDLDVSLYTPLSQVELDKNLIDGHTITNVIRIFDNPAITWSHDNIRGVRIPVIGGTVVKFENVGDIRIKLLGTDTDDTYLNTIGFAYVDHRSRGSESNNIPMRIEPGHELDDPTNIKYSYAYIPKGVGGLYLDLNMDPSNDHFDADVAANPIVISYATPQEILDNHPDSAVINNYNEDVFPDYANEVALLGIEDDLGKGLWIVRDL